ncbi:MAG TPA: hypothetical protein VMD53_16970 [Rhizomicrobium sp.]|nr:hypothetical protein [Rhizomicrobium sp.]
MKRSGIVIAYCAGIVTAFAAIATGQAIGDARKVAFDEIDVHRINVVEPDGTLRMTISNRAQFPGMIVKGKELPHASRNDVAGMIFFNDEGTENGGLVFGGRSANGHVSSGGHLSFDQYEQDQVVTLEQTEDDGHRVAGLTIDDRPDAPLDFARLSRLEEMPDGPAKTAEITQLSKEGQFGAQRLFIGKNPGKESVVRLKDAAGRTRLVLGVTAKGEATIRFLDEHGNIVRTVGARDAH